MNPAVFPATAAARIVSSATLTYALMVLSEVAPYATLMMLPVNAL